MLLRYTVTTTETGIFVIDKEFSRGYDLKFPRDAFVFVIDEDMSLDADECY